MKTKTLKVDRQKFEGIVNRLLQAKPIKREDVKVEKKKPEKLIPPITETIRKTEEALERTKKVLERTDALMRTSRESLGKDLKKLIPPQK